MADIVETTGPLLPSRKGIENVPLRRLNRKTSIARPVAGRYRFSLIFIRLTVEYESRVTLLSFRSKVHPLPANDWCQQLRDCESQGSTHGQCEVALNQLWPSGKQDEQFAGSIKARAVYE